MQVNIDKLHCHRCGYMWIPRKQEIRICPHCKSAYWDRPRMGVTSGAIASGQMGGGVIQPAMAMSGAIQSGGT